MDRLEALGTQLSQITMYDVKAMYNQAKNIVLNVSEMEAKVREATNDDPWGASSTLMQEIAQGTFNYQQFNEIMPCIYGRFMEKEARQWRQIYKALQLLEYIIKHGSERTVDDARSHLSMIKMLRSFHYIDEKGKDQGINVRNRAREIAELLSDLDKVRTERRKAKTNRNKYVGTGNDAGGFGLGGGGRYGGFGSEGIGYGEGDHYDSGGGGGGGGGGSSSSGFRDTTRQRGFEEYDAGDDDDRAGASPGGAPPAPAPRMGGSRAAPAAPKQAQVADLLGGFDDEPVPAPAPPRATDKALPSVAASFDDEFDDFQSAPSSAAPAPVAAAAPATMAPRGGAAPNLFEMLGSGAAAPQTFGHAQKPSGGGAGYFGGLPGAGASIGAFGGTTTAAPMGAFQPSQMGAFAPMAPAAATPASPGAFQQQFSAAPVMSATRAPMGQPTRQPSVMSPTQGVLSPAVQSTGAKPAGGGFDDLWSMSLGAGAKPAAGGAIGGKTMKDLEREKAQASIWGGAAAKAPGSGAAAWGDFGSGRQGGASSAGDDLLL